MTGPIDDPAGVLPRESRRNAGPGHMSETRWYSAVVRRGDMETFDRLASLVDRVYWDRRVSERRVRQIPMSGEERRRGDRRRVPPVTWAMGFLIAWIVEGVGARIPQEC